MYQVDSFNKNTVDFHNSYPKTPFIKTASPNTSKSKSDLKNANIIYRIAQIAHDIML